jgi:hypothetical protein
MADSVVYSEGLTEFPPRPGTLTTTAAQSRRDRLAKIASDHLPLVADLRIRF